MSPSVPPILSNVPPGTADTLAYSMLIVVAVFLTAGPLIAIYYRRKLKKSKPVEAAHH